MSSESFFKQNALRLLSQDWPTPRSLAEQIYILGTEEPDAGVSAAAPVAAQRFTQAAAASVPPLLPRPAQRPIQSQPGDRVNQAAQQVIQAFQAQFSQPAFSTVHRQLKRAPESNTEIFSHNEQITEPPGHAPEPPHIPQSRRTQVRSEQTLPTVSRPYVPPEVLKAYDLEFPDAIDYQSPMPWGGGNTTLSGQVIGSSVSPVQVVLYPNGSQNPPDITVAVNIIEIDPTDILPDGMWIVGIGLFTDIDGKPYYEAQVPIWIA